MTQYRKDPKALSNYIDTLLAGVGHDGSSFTDLDSCAWRIGVITHNGHCSPDRFLIQEIKRGGEDLPWGQEWALRALSRLPNVSVWFVRVLDGDGVLSQGGLWLADMADKYWGFTGQDVTEAMYRQRFTEWWNSNSGASVANGSRETSWPELYQTVESLRAFVDARLHQTALERDALKVELNHWKSIAMQLKGHEFSA